MNPLDALTSNHSPSGCNIQSEVNNPRVFDFTEQKDLITKNRINSNFINKILQSE